MLKLLKHVKKYTGLIVFIVVLLFIQANCDLSLPEYTSNIVNVGIQQGGIEDAVADTLRQETMENLFLFMDWEEQETVKEHYEEQDGLWQLEKVSSQEREELNEIFGKPMLVLLGLSGEMEGSGLTGTMEGMPSGEQAIEMLKSLPEEQMAAMKEQIYDSFDGMPDTMITQASVQFVRAEYEAQGKDLEAIQNQYLLMSGLKMLGFALIIVLASVSVTFLSCRLAAGVSRD